MDSNRQQDLLKIWHVTAYSLIWAGECEQLSGN